MGAIRVLVVDDHEMVAEGLVGALKAEPDVEVVGTAGTVQEATQMAARLGPDVVVMDYRLPDGDGVSATGAICRENPGSALSWRLRPHTTPWLLQRSAPAVSPS